MPFQIKEVTTDAEMGQLMETLYESYTHPYNGFWDMFKGQSDEECIVRYNQWRSLDPSVHWIYVVDTETNEVVGATQWNIYTENPFGTPPPPLKAYWNEEGEMYYLLMQNEELNNGKGSTLRAITEEGLNGFLSGRPNRMNRPHFLIQWCGTKSTHRRRGIGMMMMKWGTDQADQMGISAFVEATDLGEPLYRASGFVTSHEFIFDASPEKRDQEWQSWRQKLRLPMHGFFMWRPIGGKWVEGETEFPWMVEGGKA